MELTVGQRIDVFKATTRGGYMGAFKIGKWYGRQAGGGRSDLLIYLPTSEGCCNKILGMYKSEVQKVGTMVIKKLKQ